MRAAARTEEKKRGVEAGRIPRATYRLQLHSGFTLRMATQWIPYLAGLGISHVYASPLLKAVPGSTHGYDVCDCGALNPELGTEADLESLVTTLREHRMGLVLDIVPNHLGIGTAENRWWWDVLKHGRASPFARFFDIEWDNPNPAVCGKVLLPVLGDTSEAVLARGELKVMLEEDEPCLRYFEQRFPVNPSTWPEERADWNRELWRVNGNVRLLETLMASQHYRLFAWRGAEAQLNYRRFFDINSLAAVRVEDEQVFRETHALLLEWHRRGWVDGFRVDHPDGLRNPREYFERLRAAAPSAWIVAEKILEGEETLPHDWAIDGTTGYEFLNQLGSLFLDSRHEKLLGDFYEAYTGRTSDFGVVLRKARRDVLDQLFPAELDQLTRLAEVLASRKSLPLANRRESLRKALRELIACFPVYRTYLEPGRAGHPKPRDRSTIERAAADAQRELDEAGRMSLAEIVGALLRSEVGEDAENADAARAEFVYRFQQLSGPAMAKGKEDTAFYRHSRFVALNEVGGDPARFGGGVAPFFGACWSQQEDWPHRMLATSTHDTKRSEDVRARLSVLSEIPEMWKEAVRRWTVLNEPHRSEIGPERNTEYAYYQNLVGAWPISPERMETFIVKAVRESKERTSWRDSNPEYEDAVRKFVRGSMADDAFCEEVGRFVEKVRVPGYVVSLAQTLLKLTGPGVPDLYQGSELWDFSLVDPDNRRPVDFPLRAKLLATALSLRPEEAWADRESGMPKLFLIARTLKLRRQWPGPFDGVQSCKPVPVEGSQANHVVAWSRGGELVAIVPRLAMGRDPNWGDTRIALSPGMWRDELSDETFSGGEVWLDERLRRFPVGLLSKRETT